MINITFYFAVSNINSIFGHHLERMLTDTKAAKKIMTTQTKLSTKSVLFYRAHQIAKTTKVNLSIALKKAWAVLKLANQMKNEVVEFAFKKVDGSIRLAKGTLNVSIDSKGNRPFNTGVQTYYDVEADGFRCFKIENLIY